MKIADDIRSKAIDELREIAATYDAAVQGMSALDAAIANEIGGGFAVLYRACADWLERRGDEEGRS